ARTPRQDLPSRRASSQRNRCAVAARARTRSPPSRPPNARPGMRRKIERRSVKSASLERRSKSRGSVELEPRNLCVERRLVVAHEVIVALHVPAWRLEDDEALVLVHLPGRDDRLLADHSLSFYLAVFANRVVYAPPPR